MEPLEVILTSFHSNEGLPFEDLIPKIEGKIDSNGIVSLRFETKQKYVNVEANISTFGPLYNGEVIQISPYITCQDSGEDLPFSKKIDHPHYYFIELVLVTKTQTSYISNVSALKHEYWITYLPFELAFNNDALIEVKIQKIGENNEV
jgi:hypothetical protein